MLISMRVDVHSEFEMPVRHRDLHRHSVYRFRT